MDKKYVWAVEDIYADINEWNKSFEKLSKSVDFSEFKGKLSNKQDFLACMKKQELLGRELEKLSVYAMMKHDEDTADAESDALTSKITALGAKFGAETAYVVPELTDLDQSVLERYILDPELSDYDYMLKGVLKDKAHVLTENEERLLAKSSETFSSFRDIFTKIDNADLPLGKVRNGKELIPLSHGIYGVIMHGEDRALRKKTFEKYYKAYVSLINAISSTYYGNVKKNVFVAGATLKNGKLYTNGGRVLGVTAVAKDLKTAIKKSYKKVQKIHFINAYYRKDIGKRALKAYGEN